MKKQSRAFVVAIICVAACGRLAAQTPAETDGSQQGIRDAARIPRASYQQNAAATTDPQSQPAVPGERVLRINKAGNLIGTQVKNPQGEMLGTIHELVVDFNTGRVSYCALKVKESAAGPDKYLAIPLAAFQPSSDGQYLILNADKQKIAQAIGFDKNDWPSLNSAAWGAQPF
jgi:sporulation protein YlmC with PRC-barrel domain